MGAWSTSVYRPNCTTNWQGESVQLARRTSLQRLSSRADRFLSAQRQEVLRAFDRLSHLAQQFLQVFVAVDEIDIGRINDQQVRRRVMKKEVFVGLNHFFQRFVAADLLIVNTSDIEIGRAHV